MTALLNACSFCDISSDISDVASDAASDAAFDTAFDDRLVGLTLLHATGVGVRNVTLTLTGYGREHRDRSGRCTRHE
ncbi:MULTISPECIES: hypothetical protein [Streptomyces]|uniref:hypothetical protein n=1 Tax=Streptomyces TaxID=1883 RepID=UPI001392474C|nr:MULTISPECIES: hypothetical protein [Streptomyces]MDW8475432.1 hypothetical protein [Streptomyces scabiei]MDX2534711.1 hypothetical protein [Streptomyces scabiei]MDX2569291.1 hypothetical protein [Streptomyces scabiei]MDX2579685.1 hypothetical protein [Streptomyces scabiei]MDX2628186.1 hypothetical protein [Streptomyces scabiei]